MNDNELNGRILNNVKMKIATYNFEKVNDNQNNNVIKKNLGQIAATFILTIGLASGVVYAGVVTYKNIMKEPEKIENYYTSKGEDLEGKYAQSTISEDDKISSISEDDARKKVSELLKKFGYNNKEIYTIRLENSPESYNTYWYAETKDDIVISFDAQSDDYFRIIQNNHTDDYEKYRTNKEDAKKTGIELCKKYGYNTEDYNSIVVKSNAPGNEDKATSWTVTFYKEYDTIKNPYQSIEVTFIPEINELQSFTFNNKKFENNEQIITEDQANEIAIESDKKVEKEYEIENVKTELAIVKMNGVAYFRENDYEKLYNNHDENNQIFYKTSDIIRKAWTVTVIHKNNSEKNEITYAYHKYFKYYIDATTGEIIGGEAI